MTLRVVISRAWPYRLPLGIPAMPILAERLNILAIHSLAGIFTSGEGCRFTWLTGGVVDICRLLNERLV